MMQQRRHGLFAVLLFCLAPLLSARVISYAPYSDRVSFPGVQHRLSRHFVLVEGPTPAYGGPILSPLPYYNGYPFGQVVVYDNESKEEPRVVFPQDGSLAAFTLLAMRENAQGTPVILIQTNSTLNGQNPQQQWLMLISTDGGSTWTHVLFPNSVVNQLGYYTPDLGGPYARGNWSQVRIGTSDYPFVVGTSSAVMAISPDGIARTIASTANVVQPLVGMSRDGSLALVRLTLTTITVVPVTPAGQSLPVQRPTITVDSSGVYEGWVVNDLSFYLQSLVGMRRTLKRVIGDAVVDIAGADPATSDVMSFFAVPTIDYDGAWMIQRGTGKPTRLLRYTPADGVKTQWEDPTGPEVEALHAGTSGNSLLIQVHRSRPQADQRLFKDPALAVWHIGEPAPASYDELYLNETLAKGFVHVDVEKIAAGDPFVFDSGPQSTGGGGGVIISPAPGGGSDVVQEWGVVRASLKQHLVLPGIGRIEGAYGSFWKSDIILYNPLPVAQNVTLRYVANGAVTTVAENDQKTLTLAPGEIRQITDALKSIFGYDSGNGAVFIDPESGINATSRTYTRSTAGSFGFGMNAIDIFSATRPRFPVTFSGAFNGKDFRTSLILTDVSGRGTNANLKATGMNGLMGASHATFGTAANGQQQLGGLSSFLSLLPSDTGALLVQPETGEAIASLYLVDNRTNDSTYFPPDLPAPVVRTIPVIGHVDGANNSQFRSDLYLYNPAGQTRTVTLQVKPWDTPESPNAISLTMLPNEARVIRDVLFTVFGRTGLARLRYQSTSDAASIRVTSRTYTIDKDGGTYGFLMPPLNNFQSAGVGDTLEILGAVGDKNFRTNLGLVEMTAFPNNTSAMVKVDIVDAAGHTIDTFTTAVAVAGGMQINDIFHARNLGDNAGAVLIRISPVSGMIGAYATIIDNGTNDPTYLAAQLGAK